MIIGLLGDDNLSVEYLPEDKMIKTGVITIVGVDTVAAAIEKCQHLFLSFIANVPDDQVLIRECSYADEWYQPPLECVSCGAFFMMEKDDPIFCPGCGKRVSAVIKEKEK